MRAITVEPRVPRSAKLEEVPGPDESDDALIVQTLAIGVCGTDREIVSGNYGFAPPGRRRLVIGHESIGRVLRAPPKSGFSEGELVVGIVRRPDPVPCPNCAVGEWDMCRNGKYVERGIKERDGYASERYAIEPSFAVKVDSSLEKLGVLLEPASVLAKAWEQIERIGARATWNPRTVLVTGAGPIGLLAAHLGILRRLEVHVLDRVEEGAKPELVKAMGATYHTGDPRQACGEPDVVLECTGVGQLVFDVMENLAPSGIVCLTGVSSGERSIPVDLGTLNRELVLENNVVFGSVNANRRHYDAGAAALAQMDRSWLEHVVARRVPVERWTEALERRPTDVKTVIQFAS